MKVLVPLDGSPTAEGALPLVESWAGMLGMDITLISVLSLVGTNTSEARETAAVETKSIADYLEAKRVELQDRGLRVQTVVREGDPAERIVDYAVEGGYDLIAMSTHGRSGVARILMGSTTEKVLHSSPVPVLVARSPRAKR